ncbi:MAG: hypothetical protein A3B44_00500 [Candidatus Levybacteria bacterium RIFCSPLOWO2_01_FULL_38_21]|nr:MAG: hypothetical protein A3B44_00500 [Candidatus Levybacteria bacterium RIFCSPLOWO2_01_FULL_38_21]
MKLSRGGIGIMAMIMIILLASIFIVGGIFPKPSTTDPNAEKFTVITGIPLDSHNTLQLKTIKFNSCASTAAVDFLVDRSGSMRFGSKLDNVKGALKVFADNFPNEGIIAMQTFSDFPSADVPFDYFRNVKSQFINAVYSIYADGGTSTKDAFTFTKSKLDNAMPKFPNQKFSLIFISDGVPETLATNIALCPGGNPDPTYCTYSPTTPGACRCFDTNQDPTQVADEIKKSGVRIFTIGFIHDEDLKFQNDLTELMKRVASSPNDFYQAPINNQLTDILQQISVKICN